MPQAFKSAVMTNDGVALLTKAQAGECKIEFTKMAIGNGKYTEEESTVAKLQERTALKSEKNSYTISSVSIHNEKSVKVTALLTNQDPATGEALITDGYYINEIGLFAKEADGDGGTEILYSIAVTEGDQGDYMPAYNGYNPAQITQEYYATVDNSADVTLEVTNDEFVLKEDYDATIAALEAENADLQNQITELNSALDSALDTLKGFKITASSLSVGESMQIDYSDYRMLVVFTIRVGTDAVTRNTLIGFDEWGGIFYYVGGDYRATVSAAVTDKVATVSNNASTSGAFDVIAFMA